MISLCTFAAPHILLRKRTPLLGCSRIFVELRNTRSRDVVGSFSAVSCGPSCSAGSRIITGDCSKLSFSRAVDVWCVRLDFTLSTGATSSVNKCSKLISRCMDDFAESYVSAPAFTSTVSAQLISLKMMSRDTSNFRVQGCHTRYPLVPSQYPTNMPAFALWSHFLRCCFGMCVNTSEPKTRK